jgi:hypothetical protein
VKSSLPAGGRAGRVHIGVVISAMFCITAFSITAMFTHAGPLDPPSGVIAPTYKTLGEVEPRTAINAENTPGNATCLFQITKPGSYYLTGNVLGAAGKDGIAIAASSVTIDLMGFTLEGVGGSLDGINTTAVQSEITIRNGVVMNWGANGVDLYTTSSDNTVVERVQVRG